MKTLNFLEFKLSKISIFLMLIFFSILSFGQDKSGGDDADLKVDVTTTKTTTEWYSDPIYWVIGGVVLIILVALIARGGGNKSN